MSVVKRMSADFGADGAGLSTAGYRLWTASGGFGGRITSGVAAVAGGCYSANVTFPALFVGLIVWDADAGSALIAVESVDLTPAGRRANVTEVNGVTVTGTGVEADPWGASP